MTHIFFPITMIGKKMCVILFENLRCNQGSQILKQEYEGFKMCLRGPDISILLTELCTNYW